MFEKFTFSKSASIMGVIAATMVFSAPLIMHAGGFIQKSMAEPLQDEPGALIFAYWEIIPLIIVTFLALAAYLAVRRKHKPNRHG